MAISIKEEVVEPYATVVGEDTLRTAPASEVDVHELERLTNDIIGHTVKYLRRHAHMSETEFAGKLDKKRGFIRHVEAGDHPLTLTEFKAIAEALGVNHLELARDVFRMVDTASHAFTMIS